MALSNVAILDKCDSHPSPFRDPKGYNEALSNYTLFKYHGVTLGYILGPVVAALRGAKWEDWNVGATTVEINPANDTFEKRSEVVRRTVEAWREEKKFEVLAGKRILFKVFGCVLPSFSDCSLGHNGLGFVGIDELSGLSCLLA